MMAPLVTEALSSLPDHLHSHGSAIVTTIQQVAGAPSALPLSSPSRR